ncbi:alpha mannosidase, middle domain protein [Opisthorchis viverrini]|uniref:Alpha mannosidase, middle domain protein n=1 Tax=Opisthorchis viverrini TaxID=6198 RepID=A0A1S8X4Z5_OPIVI|nr:alpha mannosidase, middle domain protein [Opisthorchis viverrini]
MYQVNVFANRVAKSSNHGYKDPKEAMVDKLRQALGVMQHHDAVTGTEKQHVANDYALTLSVASKSCQTVIADAMFDLIPNLRSMTGGENPVFCDLLNISLCEATEGWKPYLNARGEGGVYIFVYNPTGWNLWSSWIRVPVYIDQSQVTRTGVILKDLRDISQKQLPYQLLPITDRTMQIPERKSSRYLANMEILFNIAAAGPPASPTGFTTFYLALKQPSRPQLSDFAFFEDFTSCSGVARLSQTTTLSLNVHIISEPSSSLEKQDCLPSLANTFFDELAAASTTKEARALCPQGFPNVPRIS